MNHKQEALRLIENINSGNTAEGVEPLFAMSSPDAHGVFEEMKKLLRKTDREALEQALMAHALVRSAGRDA